MRYPTSVRHIHRKYQRILWEAGEAGEEMDDMDFMDNMD